MNPSPKTQVLEFTNLAPECNMKVNFTTTRSLETRRSHEMLVQHLVLDDEDDEDDDDDEEEEEEDDDDEDEDEDDDHDANNLCRLC